jgi:hypothetical protein
MKLIRPNCENSKFTDFPKIVFSISHIFYVCQFLAGGKTDKRPYVAK